MKSREFKTVAAIVLAALAVILVGDYLCIRGITQACKEELRDELYDCESDLRQHAALFLDMLFSEQRGALESLEAYKTKATEELAATSGEIIADKGSALSWLVAPAAATTGKPAVAAYAATNDIYWRSNATYELWFSTPDAIFGQRAQPCEITVCYPKSVKAGDPVGIVVYADSANGYVYCGFCAFIAQEDLTLDPPELSEVSGNTQLTLRCTTTKAETLAADASSEYGTIKFSVE